MFARVRMHAFFVAQDASDWIDKDLVVKVFSKPHLE